MTFYEHAMLGTTMAIASGLPRHYGWRLAGMAGVAAMLPDWDGLSIVVSSQTWARVHRVWGHNLFTAALAGGLMAVLEYESAVLVRLARVMARLMPSVELPASAFELPAQRRTLTGLAIWGATGVLAAHSHLALDLFYSFHPDMQVWPEQLLWPVSERGWALPAVPYGDLGATLLLVAEMFALARWPAWRVSIAWLTLAAVVIYVGLRWWLRGLPIAGVPA